MRLSGTTKVHELLKAHPFLEDLLPTLSPKFELLRNRMARATLGRVANLRTAAGVAGLELGALLEAIGQEIGRRTGQPPEVEPSAPGLSRAARLEELKAIIAGLHAGGDLEAARARFSAAVEDVEASEIAAMEEELIRGGLPVSEVQRLCDVHVGAFREALDTHAGPVAPPGHPVDTYLAGNREILGLAEALGAIARETVPPWERLGGVLQRLGGVDNHYTRKENQLFPVLERHGVTGPSQVMWGVHDQIRGELKRARELAVARDAASFREAAATLARALVEMVYKEEKILLPMALEKLSEAEWAEVRRGEDELGYALAEPAAAWPAAPAPVVAGAASAGLAGLMVGDLTLEQLNLVLAHLPVDLSFVDEEDRVRFYSEGPARIFPRSPAVIGRRVQHCHPPKSVHTVQAILDSFRAGTRHAAEFWIRLGDKLVYIRYLAVRDGAGRYRGCLEVTQEVSGIRALEGERRLLAWDGDGAAQKL